MLSALMGLQQGPLPAKWPRKNSNIHLRGRDRAWTCNNKSSQRQPLPFVEELISASHPQLATHLPLFLRFFDMLGEKKGGGKELPGPDGVFCGCEV